MTNRLVRWGGARLSRRLSRELPIVGAVVAIATIGATTERKGFFGGLIGTGVDAVPVGGAAENAAGDRTSFSTAGNMIQTLTAQALNMPEVRQDRVEALRQAVESGMVAGPRMQISITMLSQTGGHADSHLPSGAGLRS